MNEELRKMYQVPGVAKLFGVSHRTIRRWLRAGRLRGVRIGRSWLIPRSEVTRLLEQGLPRVEVNIES